MKNINENRLKKVKLFLIYNEISKFNIGNNCKHSLTNILGNIRCIRNVDELKECVF